MPRRMRLDTFPKLGAGGGSSRRVMSNFSKYHTLCFTSEPDSVQPGGSCGAARATGTMTGTAGGTARFCAGGAALGAWLASTTANGARDAFAGGGSTSATTL
eukprot:3192696-Prymnesium_polylepis.1